MKFFSFVTVILIFGFISASGQPCLPGTTSFNSQADIDSFQTNNPNCTEIEGGIHISGNDIKNLNGLNVLTSIGYELWITGNDSLSSFDGLENITSVGGPLYIRDNNSLINFSGLDNLTTVGGNFWVWENSSLTSLSGLSNLNSIGGFLDIFNNDALTTINGIDNINPASISNLYIVDNDLLSNCEVQSVCEYLTSQYGSINIYNNASGCNNPPEVAANCGVTLPCLPLGNYYFTKQEDIDNFTVNYPGCYDLEGDVSISGSYISNLAGLSDVSSIGGMLIIFQTTNLGSLMSLYNLNSIGGLMINQTLLGSLTGLHNVASIYGSLMINNNNLLNSIMALNNVSSFYGEIWIWSNPGLTNLSGLDNITPNSITDLSIQGNASLSNCEVLSICEYLSIPGASVTIQGNATGCNSPVEVQDSCEANAVNIDEQFIKDKLILYPNPANQELNISVEGLSIDEIVIYTLTGQQVLQERPVDGSIDITDLQPSMYIVEVMVEGRRIRQKLLVE